MQRQQATKLIHMGQPARDLPMVQLRGGRRAAAMVRQRILTIGTGVAGSAHREEGGVVIVVRTAAGAPAAQVQEAAAVPAVAAALPPAAAPAVGPRGLHERLLLRWQQPPPTAGVPMNTSNAALMPVVASTTRCGRPGMIRPLWARTVWTFQRCPR